MTDKTFFLIRKIVFLLAMPLMSCTEDNLANEPEPQRPNTVSGSIPALYIETENHAPIVSKTEYLNAIYWLDPMEAEDIPSLGSKSRPLQMQIRGRGHSSWKGAKKPYKIKLDKKTAVMGMPKNKHWALLKPTENTVAGL